MDIRAWEQAIRDGEFEPFEIALQFLQSFGGLVVRHPAGRFRDFHFDPLRCLGFAADPIAVAYPRRAGVRRMCPIGESHGGDMILCMDPQGCVYAGAQQNLIKVANSGLEAIERLISDGPFERIP